VIETQSPPCVTWVRRFLRSSARQLARPTWDLRASAAVAATIVVGGAISWMLWPMLTRWDTYGFHDWDLSASHRYITRVGLLRYRELPFWNPWACGGFPEFGFVEGASNLISPYLPVYLFLDLRTALRIEAGCATVIAAAGAYYFAARFTRSVALAALVAALFSLNGRWALQLATGHSWHLQFCWLPWALGAFERAQCKGREGHAVLAGGFLALMAFMGGIYPLPYAALCLVAYAGLLALQRFSIRPLGILATTGGIAAGLAAPKLLLVADTMTNAPRLTESSDAIGIAELAVMLTARGQRYGDFPVPVPQYDWHEWGIYIGSVPLVALTLGALFAQGQRENAVRLTGLGTLLIGLGAFHAKAPWSLLHRLPVFSSFHAPSRILVVMVLLLGTAFVAWVTGPVERLLRRAPWFDLVLLLPVALIAGDLGTESQGGLRQAFWMEAPRVIEAAPGFEHHTEPMVRYTRGDWKTPAVLPMMANQGVIDCYGVPASYSFGARAAEDPRYHGMVEVLDGKGSAAIAAWSPNGAVVRVEQAEEGATVVYNMNYDPSWRANGAPAINLDNRVAVRVHAGSSVVTLRYWPRRLGVGLLIGVGTVGAIASWLHRRRNARPERCRGGASIARSRTTTSARDSHVENQA
jgi:hypothetical protein